MIGQYLNDLVDDAGYLPADLGQAAGGSARSQQDVDTVLAALAEISSARCVTRET